MTYRNLTNQEISQLSSNGCRCETWELVKVKQGFEANQVRNTSFAGQVQLGHYRPGTGIDNARITNCNIEDHVTISQVGHLENYIVRSHASIIQCGSIASIGKSLYGNGVKVSCINEGGGREVTLFNGLNAQIAYLLAFSRHRPTFVGNLEKLIQAEVELSKSEKGVIGHHAVLISATTIRNIMVGDYARIEGSVILDNGTIVSSSDSPTYFGHGVMAYDFIASAGCRVDNGSILKKCFVGESSIIDRQFSAENTLIFSNCQLFNGEACSVFAAPYTVSHHKSTLLIATYCSFINVGSGSNQSNHMYKLGPVHQGILERGCKLGSDSYVLWPGKIGPFTFVTGRHYSNPDISEFPFSYLLDENGTSQLVPGANLRSIGTLRDSQKWPERDARKATKSDFILFDLFNPYDIALASKGKKRMMILEESQKGDALSYSINDVRIKKPALKRGIDIYDEAITIFVGDWVIEKMMLGEFYPDRQTKPIEQVSFEWVDVAGLLMNKTHLVEMLDSVECENIPSISKLTKQLEKLFTNYRSITWEWIKTYSYELVGIDLSTSSTDELLAFIHKWEQTSQRFYMMLVKDAQKEFSERSKIGYGITDDKSVKDHDFNSVRGNLEANAFVEKILKKSSEAKELAQKAKASLNQ